MLKMLKNFAKFRKDEKGNFLILFGLTLPVVFTSIGFAVDYANIQRYRNSIQNALDASALATSKRLGTGTREDMEQFSRDFFLANLSTVPAEDVDFIFNDTNKIDASTIDLSANFNYNRYFGGVMSMLIGNNADNIHKELVETQVIVGDQVEIALVLDNSGSMRHKATSADTESKIETTRKVTKQMVVQLHTLYKNSQYTDPVKFAVVPFSASVNIGDDNDSETWMDTAGLSSIHHDNLDWSNYPDAQSNDAGGWMNASGDALTRFTLFNDMNGNSDWNGCVEARPGALRMNDAAPNTASPDTLYVPLFAPDEPDNYNGDQRKKYEVTEQTTGAWQGDTYCFKANSTYSACEVWTNRNGGLPADQNGSVANLDPAQYSQRNNYYGYSGKIRNEHRVGGDWRPVVGPYDNATPGTTTYNTTLVNDGSISGEDSYLNSYIDDDKNMNNTINGLSGEAKNTALDVHRNNSGSSAFKTGMDSVANEAATGNPLSVPQDRYDGQIRRMAWTWKYKNATPDVDPNNEGLKGPNFGCTSPEVTPLKKTVVNEAALTSNFDPHLTELNAPPGGMTNIQQGVVWGWRALSSQAPFDEGRSENRVDNRKIMVVMTDGNNDIREQSAFAKSVYGGYGFSMTDRIYENTTLAGQNHSYSDDEHRQAVDEQLEQTCVNAKQAGISIYTIAFDLPADSPVKQRLEDCASYSQKKGGKAYFNASNSTELATVFATITADIANLRISK